MARQKYGALPSQRLLDLAPKIIKGMDPGNISPSSLDLRISDEIYEIDSAAFPVRGERVRDILPLMGADTRPYDLDRPLRAGRKYIVRLKETLALPSRYYGYCNPKSSTGRIDVHVRVLADEMPRYDSIAHGFKGELWLLIEPRSFGIIVPENYTLAQLRLFNADTRFSEDDLIAELEKEQLLWHPEKQRPFRYNELHSHDHDGSIMLTLMIPENGVVGYRCIAVPEEVLRLEERNVDPRPFFQPVCIDGSVCRFHKEHFYILSSAEPVRIPPEFAAEMRAMDDRSGEFRSHYAGFLDPGWGWGEQGEGHGQPFTLEMRPFEDLAVRRGQPVARVVFERMAGIPNVLYYHPKSNYVTQEGPKLAKQFAPYPH